MIFRPQDIILPHYCCSCGEIGDVLCESCFYDIVSDNELAGRCIVCMKSSAVNGVCGICQRKVPYSRAWVAAERRDAARRLVSSSKYESCCSGCDRQADILNSLLPAIPTDTIVVPVPTIRAHIRQRGYGHTERIARHFAKLRQLPYIPLIYRKVSCVQNGADLPTRIQQAKVSFSADTRSRDKHILLIDDVFTTGSTVKYAARSLLDAGAATIWVAITCRQTLDDKG